MLRSHNVIEYESRRFHLSSQARDFLSGYLASQQPRGALPVTKCDELSSIERSDVAKLQEIREIDGQVGSFAELFFVALVEAQLSILKDARVALEIEQTPTSVKDEAWTQLHDAGFIEPVEGYWVVTQRGLTAYFNYGR